MDLWKRCQVWGGSVEKVFAGMGYGLLDFCSYIFLIKLEKCLLLFKKNSLLYIDETVPCSDSEIQAKIW